MHGFLLVDKPRDVTSFYCVKVLRKVFNVKRIGFAGTLDPLATGLMIFGLGEATKLITFLEKMDKVYEVTIHFGGVSDTYDAKGKIEHVKNSKKPLRSTIEKLLEDDFLGQREQMPPVYSAIQIEGKRAYDLARKGKTVILKKRPVHFFDIKVKSYSWPRLRLMVHCSSGTYVRSLAHDLGQKLGCGGYVEELRRTKIGAFSVKNAVELNTLTRINLATYFLQPQEMFADFLQLELSEKEYRWLAQGGFIDNLNDFTKGPILALYKGKCMGVLEVFQGKLKFEKKFNIV